jgi:hypothetical protein
VIAFHATQNTVLEVGLTTTRLWMDMIHRDLVQRWFLATILTTSLVTPPEIPPAENYLTDWNLIVISQEHNFGNPDSAAR